MTRPNNIFPASEALGMPVARVCLEQDGTEVDEEEYFGMLEKDTPLMVLEEDDRWLPSSNK
jgi:CIDE-N domain